MEASRATKESFVIVWGYIYVCTRVKNYVNLYSINEISIFQKFKILLKLLMKLSDDQYLYKQYSKSLYLLIISYRLYLHNCGLLKNCLLTIQEQLFKLPSPSSLNNKITTKLCPLT